MIGRVVLVSLLALAACKKKEGTGDPPAAPAGSSSTTGTTATKPTGDKRVSDSSWSTQTGPGFTVKAPGPATHEKVPAQDGDRAFDRYTFFKSDLESYVVEITELPPDGDVKMEIGNMRMSIAMQTQAVRAEEFVEGGEVLGRDLRYVVDQGDDTLEARSKLVGKGNKIYQVRGIAPDDEARIASADTFIDSFAFAP